MLLVIFSVDLSSIMGHLYFLSGEGRQAYSIWLQEHWSYRCPLCRFSPTFTYCYIWMNFGFISFPFMLFSWPDRTDKVWPLSTSTLPLLHEGGQDCCLLAVSGILQECYYWGNGKGFWCYSRVHWPVSICLHFFRINTAPWKKCCLMAFQSLLVFKYLWVLRENCLRKFLINYIFYARDLD